MLILFVASPKNGDLLDELCRTAGTFLTKQIENQPVSLSQIVKTRNLSGYAMVFFDLSIVESEERDLNDAIFSMQFMYPQIRLVAVDFQGENVDTLLRLRQIGVENIVQKTEDIPVVLSPAGMKNADEISENKPLCVEVIVPPATKTREIPALEKPETVENHSENQTNEPFIKPLRRSRFLSFGKPKKEEAITQIEREKEKNQQAKESFSVKLPPIRFQQKSKSIKPIKIGVCGVMRRIGTTTHALGVASFLSEEGETIICLEANENGHFRRFSQYYAVEKNENCLERFAGIPLGYADISIPENTRYIVQDCGLLDENQATYIESDIKILCIGSKPWELSWLGRLFQNKPPFLSQTHYIFSFTDESERANALAMMGKLAPRTHFSAYAPSYAQSRANYPIYQAILFKKE